MAGDSPIKPKFSIFPSPTLPPFSIYPSSPAHTRTNARGEHVDRPIKPIKRVTQTGFASPSRCYPSAEPLQDDPFLVPAPDPRLANEDTSDDCSEPLNHREHIVSPRFRTIDDGPGVDPMNTNDSFKRAHAPRGYRGTLGRHAITQRLAPKVGGCTHKSIGIETNSPTSLLLPSPALLGLPSTETEVRPWSNETLTLGHNLDNEMLDLASEAPTQVISVDCMDPSMTARTLFPTPSLTSSFDTPSTASILPTPARNVLFPSPDITDSPTIAYPARGRGRMTRSRLALGYVVPSPVTECDLIGGKKSMGPASGHHNTPDIGPSTSEWMEMSPPDGEQEATKRANEIPISKSSLCEELEPSLVSDSAHVVFGGNEATDSSGTEERVKAVIEFQPTANRERIASKNERKRTRGDDMISITPKRVKVAGKNNASASISKKKSDSIDISHADFGSGRATRSQSRAIAALLSLGSSREKQLAEVTGNQQQSEVPRAKNTGQRTITRKRGQSQIFTENTCQTSRRSQRANQHDGHGQTSGQAVPPGEHFSSTVSTGSLISDVTERESRRVKAPEACEENKPQEAGHVSTRHQAPASLLPPPDPALVYRSNGEVIYRSLPENLSIHKGYPKWYRRFPVSAYFAENDPGRKFVLGDQAATGKAAMPGPGLIFNSTAHFNLYNPRFVRGTGDRKLGVCPICVEPTWRGGAGVVVFLNTKISQYNYHMQNYHGLSSKTGLPFSPPVAFRQQLHRPSQTKTRERETIEEGQCHVPEMYWWKHAAACHGTSQLAGDKDPYIEDAVYRKLREYEALDRDELCSEDQQLESESECGRLSPNPLKELISGAESGSSSGSDASDLNTEDVVACTD
ncbi:unnamed protein product [Rhizoctonia solani]|uniref:Transcription regulator Rua1 C-terminal domain-containing protein n=1 Tax=Rhizoctonia solani TaxID=456999 RepID=A0A8H3A3K7_9AGAM|nr:unnamed protein product [Rhizoctonia solani]